MVIQTNCGAVRGVPCEMPGVTAFKGIRYAAAGRWEYPAIVTHWDGEYDASKYGNCCYQPRSFYDESKTAEKAFYYNEFRKGETYTYSEDCLFLNIWMPQGAGADSKLPVIFYIHGGGFTGGCGHEKHFDGPRWAQKNVVAVTINYRLGPLGFLVLPELAAEAGHTGNYGLYDQLAALQWVHDNIAAFGGNPDNVTVMGQSAGAMSVQQLLLSPLSKPYIAKAVLSSGGGVNKIFGGYNPPEKRYGYWKAVMERCGCKTLEEFRAVEPEKLLTVSKELQKEMKMGMASAPCTDGVFTPKAPMDIMAAGEQAAVPVMLGTTSHDMFPPIMQGMAVDYCQAMATSKKTPAYAWFFNRMLPGDKNGAWHSADLWYWFGTLTHCWRPFVDKDWDLSNEMIARLTAFARTGNPNDTGLVEWQPVTENSRNVLILGDKSTHMGKPNRLKLFWTMLTNKAVGE